MIDFTKIFQLKGLKPKNIGQTIFYECCDLTKKVYLVYTPYTYMILHTTYIAIAAPIESDSSNIGQIYWHGCRALWSLSKSTVSGSLMDQPHHQPTKGGIVKEVLFLLLCSLVLSLDLLLDSGQVITIETRCRWLGGYGLALMGWCYFSNGWEMVITKQPAYTRSAQVFYLFSKLCGKYISLFTLVLKSSVYNPISNW